MSVVTFEEFESSLTADEPPDVAAALAALWHDGRGDWETAHKVAQDVADAAGAWVHAYLHRKEGDLANARYWYQRAGKPVASGSLEDEWRRIAADLCQMRSG